MIRSHDLKYLLFALMMLIIQEACKKVDDNHEKPFANQ